MNTLNLKTFIRREIRFKLVIYFFYSNFVDIEALHCDKNVASFN